jgi:CRP-like cAMP-binding protein
MRYSVQSFSKDEIVYSPKKYDRMLGFVLSGGCNVYKCHTGDQELLMNSLKPGASFGVLAVFSGEKEYPTVIRATKKTEILFIDDEECKALISKEPDIALSVITFLADKVSFLNTKISTLSGKTITEKLAIYLLCEMYKQDSETIPFNIQRVSSAISVSRQTVYRGIEALAAENLITYEIKKIIINDRIGLERLTK